MKLWLYSLLLTISLPLVGAGHAYSQSMQANLTPMRAGQRTHPEPAGYGQATDPRIAQDAKEAADSVPIAVLESRQCQALVQKDFKGFAGIYTSDCTFYDCTTPDHRKSSADERMAMVRKDCARGIVTNAYVIFSPVRNSSKRDEIGHACIYYLTLKTPGNEMAVIVYYLEQRIRTAANKISASSLYARRISNLGSFAKPNYLLGAWYNQNSQVSKTQQLEFLKDGTVIMTGRSGETITGKYKRLDEERISVEMRGFITVSGVCTVTLLPSPDALPMRYRVYRPLSLDSFGVTRQAKKNKALLEGVKSAGGYPEYLYPTSYFSSSTLWIADDLPYTPKPRFRSVLLLKETSSKEPDYYQR